MLACNPARLASWLALVSSVTAINIAVKADGGNATNGHQYGFLHEDINNSGDGGLYAELVRNRAFQSSYNFTSSLDAWFETRNIPIVRFGFREDGEMYDAYEVQRCTAVVGEATELARERLRGGPNGLKSRFLPDHLAAFPIIAATPAAADAQWAAIAAWTIDTLVAASPKETYYTGGGLRAVTPYSQNTLD